MSRLLAACRVGPVLAGVAAIALLAFGTSTASAAVHVDPGGPAGNQYRLPLDSVRGDVSGNPEAGVPGGSDEVPIFGEGIHPVGESGDGDGGTGGSGDGNGGDGQSGDQGSNGVDGANGANGNGVDGGKSVAVDPKVTELVNGTGGGTSSTFEMILLIGGMALIGLTAGLIGRRTL